MIDTLIVIGILYVLCSYFVSCLFVHDWIFNPKALPVTDNTMRLALVLFMPIFLAPALVMITKNYWWDNRKDT